MCIHYMYVRINMYMCVYLDMKNDYTTYNRFVTTSDKCY